MNGPERLKQGSGFSKKLLDSAALDQPSASARRRAVLFASTAGGLSMTNRGGSGVRGVASGASLGKTLVTWIAIGAAASAALAFGVSRLSAGAHTEGGLKAAAELPTLPEAKPLDITPEHVVPPPTLAPSPPSPQQAGEAKALASAAPSASALSKLPSATPSAAAKPLATPTSSARR